MVSRRAPLGTSFIIMTTLATVPAAAQPADDPCLPLASCLNEMVRRDSVPAYVVAADLPPERHETSGDESDDASPPEESSDVPSDDGAVEGSSETQSEAESDDGSDLAAFLLAAAGVGISVWLLSELFDQTDWVSPSTLDADGPQFGTRQRVGQFRMQGYVRSNWPVVLDLESVPGATTWLEVRVRGGRRHYFNLPGEGRRVAVIRPPELRDRNLSIANLRIHSALLRPDERPLYRPLRVYGIGAGANAVEPTNLAALTFQPGPMSGAFGSPTFWIRSVQPERPRSPADVHYSLAVTQPYANARVEVLRLPRSEGGQLTRVSQANLSPLLRGTPRHGWAQMGLTPNPPRGVYMMQARAWEVGARQGDWIGAMAPNLVFIP